ncbi:hypothetical protein MTO96_043137 [Rhipicephalus appendiculatus]
MCDGSQECDDGSDEDVDMCRAVKSCQPNNFVCWGVTDGIICVPMERRCDGKRDCGDGTDEGNCMSPSPCTEGQFACKSGESCIPMIWMCNGDRDCSDGSDEDVDICNEDTKCPEDRFMCHSAQGGFRCLPAAWRCNGYYDCRDDSDEANCTSAQTCKQTEFQCEESGECVPVGQRCDGERNCEDSSDGRNCTAEKICSEGQIPC